MRDYKVAVVFPDGSRELSESISAASLSAINQSISNLVRGGEYNYPGVAKHDYLDRLDIELIARKLEGRL